MNMLTTTRRNPLSPWSGFRELEDHMNRLFSQFPLEANGDSGAWLPAVDLRETEEGYLLEADLPGMSKDDIDLRVEGDMLTLKGERKNEEWKQDEGKGWRSVERSYGSFHRSFRIPGGVDTAKVDAKFENGVLKVSLPKPENAKPRQIEVKVN